MRTEIIVAIVSGIIALCSALLALWGQFRVNKINYELEALKMRAEREQKASLYREPLVRAAADLQSRLYNILERGFVDAFMIKGTPREMSYAKSNTAFLFAQFFAWTEATRLELQFISLEEDSRTREFAALQGRIYSLLQTDHFPKAFRLFTGEQRAIGERMLVQSTSGYKCLGYSDFLRDGGISSDVLLANLHHEVDSLTSNVADALPRLAAFQHALVELIDYLDPKFIRFPEIERSKWQRTKVGGDGTKGDGGN